MEVNQRVIGRRLQFAQPSVKKALRYLARVAAFAILMVLTSGLSGFATIFMTLTYYYLKRLDSQDSRLRRFYERTASGRRVARQSTWSSLVVYLSSLALLVISRVAPQSNLGSRPT